MNEDTTTTPDPIALGTWIGREQACNARAPHASSRSATQNAYKSLNLSWEEFYPTHAGISRKHADCLIAHLAEFGVPYFQLTDIVPVSPAVYREIKPAIADGAIEFRGERIPITPENAPKIKATVNALRKENRARQVRRAHSHTAQHSVMVSVAWSASPTISRSPPSHHLQRRQAQ